MAMSSTPQEKQAQAAYKSRTAQLGRSVWLTLERSLRADTKRAEGLEERLEAVGNQVTSVSKMNIHWMKMGNWEERTKWTDDEWLAFLRMPHASFVFDESVLTREDKELFDSFMTYMAFYASLPERPKGVPNEVTIESVGRKLDIQLATIHERVGNPCPMVNTKSGGWSALVIIIIITGILYFFDAMVRKMNRGSINNKDEGGEGEM